ncbi:hypothetical protein EV189_2835 [Motilibacter rhizosphaerae]|uniref:Phytanoyl-CoA dioxygenase PhyH n=1 Tax=Motilibacter rhizosphaerae TaxID=598652 RepID=A0A4Q7NQV3_9ACTN|nr:hypothetical protein [Motilibacter rhizosphaerae]RZS87406.1 hypothetical protein EV189_2835 [Motilibacter rhizosphaerae]
MNVDTTVRVVRRAARRGTREARQAVLDATFAVQARHQRVGLPPLEGEAQRIVAALQRGEAAAAGLDELKFGTTAEMERVGRQILADMAEEPRLASEVRGPRIRTATAVPALRAWALEPQMLAIASNYIGSPAVFQGVHARIDPVSSAQDLTELWHRDGEDRRMLKAFVYFHDITIDHGPFEYVVDSELDKGLRRRILGGIRDAERNGRLGLDDDEMAALVPRSQWRNGEVPGRTALFADPTAFFHHGRLRTKARSSLFFVYTSAFPREPGHCRQYWDDTFPAPTGF